VIPTAGAEQHAEDTVQADAPAGWSAVLEHGNFLAPIDTMQRSGAAVCFLFVSQSYVTD
jgi:hypothetical protein